MGKRQDIWESAQRQGAALRAHGPLHRLFLLHADANAFSERCTDSWPTSQRCLDSIQAEVRVRSTGAEVEALVELGDAIAIVYLRRGRLGLSAAGGSRGAIKALIAAVRHGCPETAVAPREHQVSFTFSWVQKFGVGQMSRSLSVPTWREVEANYSRVTRRGLSALAKDFEPAGSGQTVIWHGEPGTGKTSALRALAWEWRDWCDFHVVTDPDALFGSSSAYLLEILDMGDGGERFRALVLEDAGELLRRDARRYVGQGLSRFLNVCDGLLGQEEKLLLLVTTNEPLTRLHPAVSRPGRCAAEVEFTTLSKAEANRWLAKRCEARVMQATSLADLYALANGERAEGARVTVSPSVGFAAALDC